MSGSGSAVFGIFESKEDAEFCVKELKGICDNATVCSFTSKLV